MRSLLIAGASCLLLTLGMSSIPAPSNAQTTKSCSPASLNSTYRKLGKLPVIEVKTNGARYSSTSYNALNKRFAYLVIDSETQKMVARVDLNYSTNIKGQNVANIKVCGIPQQGPEFPAIKFNFSKKKSIGINAIGTQNLTYIVPSSAHTATIQTIFDASH